MSIYLFSQLPTQFSFTKKILLLCIVPSKDNRFVLNKSPSSHYKIHTMAWQNESAQVKVRRVVSVGADRMGSGRTKCEEASGY